MASSPKKVTLKGNTTLISRLKAATVQGIAAILTVCAWVAGQSGNPLSGLVSDSVWQSIVLGAALITGLYAGWRNNNWTTPAIVAQNVLTTIKSTAKAETAKTATITIAQATDNTADHEDSNTDAARSSELDSIAPSVDSGTDGNQN